jgi:hypothetical protein
VRGPASALRMFRSSKTLEVVSRGGRPFHGHRWPHPSLVNARKQGRVLRTRFLPRFLGISKKARSPTLRARRRSWEPRRCGYPSHPRTPALQDRGGLPPYATQASRTHLVLLPLWIFLDLFFGSWKGVLASGRPSLRSPSPRIQQKGTRLFGSGWPKAAVGGLPRVAWWPSRLASGLCLEPSVALRCHARRVACSSA